MSSVSQPSMVILFILLFTLALQLVFYTLSKRAVKLSRKLELSHYEKNFGTKNEDLNNYDSDVIISVPPPMYSTERDHVREDLHRKVSGNNNTKTLKYSPRSQSLNRSKSKPILSHIPNPEPSLKQTNFSQPTSAGIYSERKTNPENNSLPHGLERLENESQDKSLDSLLSKETYNNSLLSKETYSESLNSISWNRRLDDVKNYPERIAVSDQDKEQLDESSAILDAYSIDIHSMDMTTSYPVPSLSRTGMLDILKRRD